MGLTSVLVLVAGGLAGWRAGAAPQAIFPAASIKPWVMGARSSRADIVCIGDSNQAYGGNGWDHGITRAAEAQFGLYATGLFSAGENQGWGLGLGYRCSVLSTACCVPEFAHFGAPAYLDSLMSGSVFMYPWNYVYLSGGQATGGSSNLGMLIQASNGINVNERLRYEVTYGLFDGASAGSFQLSIRLGQSPFSSLVTGPMTSTSGESGWAHNTASVDLPAGSRNAALNARFTPWGTNIIGPAIFYTQRVINLDRPRGVEVSTLYARGSQSARDMALGFQSASDGSLTLYFTKVREAQGPVKRVLIRISTGLNDLNENLPSLGPAQLQDGASEAAYADNLLAIVNRLRGIWALNQWDDTELSFLFAVSHPIEAPDHERLVAYRNAAASLAVSLPRASVVRLDALTDANEMLTRGWYQSNGNDRFHLTQEAYEVLSQREISALVEASCLTDLNNDRSVNTVDLVSVLGRFGLAVPVGTSADFNGDGLVNTLDLTIFLGTFGKACWQ